MLRVRIWMPLQPTEDAALLLPGLQRLFPGFVFSSTPSELTGEGTTLAGFGEAIRRQRIPDAARQGLLRGRTSTGTRLQLNKQVLTVGKVTFAEEAEGPLGDATVEVETEDLEGLLDRIAPDTTRPGWAERAWKGEPG